MKRKTLEEHLFGSGPKRILALDGGGIRGALTLGYLARIEKILRERFGNDPEFRLCDYFDLIGGTSTGSIIATGLALGFSVAKLQDIYRSLADEVFKRPLWRLGVLSSKFPSEPLVKALKNFFGDVTLGGEEVRTGLMIMTKRLDTGSPWVLHNNPKGKFFSPQAGDTSTPNRDYLLRHIVRASTAAPHYFEPEKLKVAPDLYGAFVDGGVSPFNNPSLSLMMLSTLKGFGLNWSFGKDKLLLVSVGTGARSLRLDPDDILDMPAVELAAHSILSLMADADWLGQAMLQWMSRSPTAWSLDSEIEDLGDDVIGGGDPLISYLRYQVFFEQDWIKKNLGLDKDKKELESLFAMDKPENVRALGNLGATAAANQIENEHFPIAFDIE